MIGAALRDRQRRDREALEDGPEWTPDNIKALRKHADMTRLAMARRLNVTRWTVARWEGGIQRPGVLQRKRLLSLAQEYRFNTTVCKRP